MVGKNCADIERYLSSYIDGSLDDETKALVEKELLACEDCQQKLLLMQAISQTATSMPEIEVSDAFKASLHERLLAEQANKETRKKRFVWSKVSSFVAVAAVLFLSVMTLSSLPEHPELTSEELTKQQMVESKTEDEDIAYSVSKGSSQKDVEQERSVMPSENNKNTESAISPQVNETPSPLVEQADVATAASETTTLEPCATGNSRERETENSVTDKNASVENKQILHYYFSQEGFLKAQNILCAYSTEGEAWAVPIDAAEQVTSSLKNLTGYKSEELKTEAIEIEKKENESIYIVLHVVQ